MARKDEDYLIIARVIALAWQDEAYKKRLLAHPVEVLREEGLEVPKGMRVKVLEDTPTLRHLVIPVKPAGLSDKELEEYAEYTRCSVR